MIILVFIIFFELTPAHCRTYARVIIKFAINTSCFATLILKFAITPFLIQSKINFLIILLLH